MSPSTAPLGLARHYPRPPTPGHAQATPKYLPDHHPLFPLKVFRLAPASTPRLRRRGSSPCSPSPRRALPCSLRFHHHPQAGASATNKVPGPRPPRHQPITSKPPRRRLPPMGESPRAGPTRHTDLTSTAEATAAGRERTQHGGGQAGPNYSSGRAREVRSPPKAGSVPLPPAAATHLSPLALPPTELSHTYTPLFRSPGKSRNRPRAPAE